MKKWLLFFVSLVFIHSNINADIMAEISKRDRDNPIRLTEYWSYVLYAKDGYLYTDYLADDFGEPSIVAYQIRQDMIKLIVRIKTWDFAFRIYDYFYEKDGIDQFAVDVHDYYLVELVYVNDKLETYCNRIRDINTNGFIYNEAEIGGNINKIPPDTYHVFYPRYDITLTEGMETKIVSLVNERTDSLSENSYTVDTYDYYYHVLIEDKQIRINGYLLNFSNKFDYRSQILILRSGNTPQSTPPEEALDYLGTWRYTGTGGMGFDKYRRTITITISAEEFHFHFSGYEREYEYKLTDIKWTKIVRPDEDFRSYVEIPVDNFKGAYGYLITGKVINNTGEWPDANSTAEYIYIGPHNKNIMLWYNARISNYILIRQTSNRQQGESR
jgi:hypothetical protein